MENGVIVLEPSFFTAKKVKEMISKLSEGTQAVFATVSENDRRDAIIEWYANRGGPFIERSYNFSKVGSGFECEMREAFRGWTVKLSNKNLAKLIRDLEMTAQRWATKSATIDNPV